MYTFAPVDLNDKEVEVYFCPDLYSHLDMYKALDEEIKWKDFKVKVYDKVFSQPRDSSYVADDKRPYFYSGFDREIDEWTPILSNIRDNLQEIIEKIKPNHPKLNAVLCNRYKSGEEYIGAHSDNEGDLHKDAFIVSVSVGAARDFVFKHKQTDERVVLNLPHGSVLLMGKGCQTKYKHELPKRKKVKEPRINLTFRCVLQRSNESNES